MTDQDWQELGRRAVACRGWRWLPGMLATWGWSSLRILRVDGDGPRGRARDGSVWFIDDSDWPDFRDPATLGCLLALVREACEPERAPGDWPLVCTYQNSAKKWGVGAWLNESGKATFAALVLSTYPTEAAALVAALEAVP